MTYGSTTCRQTLSAAQTRSTYSEGGCCSECQSCSAGVASITGLAAYTASRRRQLVKSLKNGTALECKLIQPGTPEANEECIRLRGVWKAVKGHIRAAQKNLNAVANQMEQARRDYAEQMDKDIAAAVGKLLGDVLLAIGSALKKTPILALADLVRAGVAFDQWRRKYNRDLPTKLTRFLIPWKIRYDSAVEKLRYWVDEEKRVTRNMSRLRCANF
ncbi:MAG: hypothetical protein AB3N28_03035 [Kordiimonas sp.]